jgi:hypothetical protein
MKLRPGHRAGRRTARVRRLSRFHAAAGSGTHNPKIFGNAFVCEAARFILSRARQGCGPAIPPMRSIPNPTPGHACHKSTHSPHPGLPRREKSVGSGVKQPFLPCLCGWGV